MPAVQTEHLSRAAYLAQSPEWPAKHEWINGVVYAMSGGSFRHNAITANVIASLTHRLKGSPCRATSSDQRVFVPATGASLYPDVMVICGAFQAAADDPQAVTNPVLIVEVLSPSTRSYDLGAKLEHYLLVPSVQQVLFIEPDASHCILHTRSAIGWTRQDLRSSVVPLQALDTELPLAAIYADLDQL